MMQCLLHLRQHRAYEALAKTREWRDLSQPQAADVTVVIMGMGVLGQDAAHKLAVMGFEVIGWSRTKRAIEGIDTFDAAGLDAFLGRTDFLVGLLPLTAGTRGIFDAVLFKKLSRKVRSAPRCSSTPGRGGSQVEADILQCLDSGVLGGASLDVFEEEPLLQESRFWTSPSVYVTPHVAASSDVKALFAHVNEQIHRFESGLPLNMS
ncbi:NAD(P)-dependent oxidoreductase [Mesorhizobium sp. M1348]|uniref:NAD(P)-dependent oxidoreductase n=1 Tax=Mesorhizobium sp. M1348 TaxID=2957089 RepID=UPI0033387372